MGANKQKPPKWKKFEEFVASIQKSLTPQAKVTHDELIKGKSGVKRQLDVSVRYNLGQFTILVVIDCKDWKEAVDISDVGSFADLVEDVGANKGAIICNAGFTSGAKQRAKEKGIDLFRAIDAESLDWPVYVAMPTLCDFRSIKKFNFTFRHTAPTPFAMPAVDPRYLQIYKSDGTLVDILQNLLTKAWNTGNLPSEPGEHRNIQFIEEEAYTKVNDSLYGPVEITTDITIEQKLYFGEVPIQKGQGFMNEMTGGFTTKSIETGTIDVVEVEKTWRRLKSKNELAVKPAMVLVASDHYPVIET